MKVFVTLVSLLISTAYADSTVGRAELTTYSDGDGPSGSISVWEQNNQIIGQGFSLGGGNGTVNLTRTADGVSGYSLDRFFKVSCGTDSCVDNGSTNMNLKLVRTADGFTLDGQLDFVPVHAEVSATKISISADSSFDMKTSGNGNFSGEGATSYQYVDTYEINLTSSGTLAGVTDPAVFTAVILNAFVR